jgi:hypothetical protein
MKPIHYILICCFLGISLGGYSQDTLACNEVEVSCQVKGEKMFNTKKEYKQNQDFIPGCTANIGYIDFEKNTLIGLSYFSSSRPIFTCEMVYDKQTKIYSHNTVETVYGIFKNGVVYSHWCLIPKLKDGQELIFKHQVFHEKMENYPEKSQSGN